MAGKIPRQPEQGRTPERSLFNLDALAVDEVQLLGRALYAQYDREVDQGHSLGIDTSGRKIIEGFLANLRDSIVALAESDPDRGKEILQALSVSDNSYDHELSAGCAPAFFKMDYELARDVLMRSYQDPYVFETTICIVTDILQEEATYFTPEQAVDFRRYWDAIEVGYQA